MAVTYVKVAEPAADIKTRAFVQRRRGRWFVSFELYHSPSLAQRRLLDSFVESWAHEPHSDLVAAGYRRLDRTFRLFKSNGALVGTGLTAAEVAAHPGLTVEEE